MTVVSFFPHGATQTEGEDDGQQLDGNDNDHGANYDVEIILYQHDQLVVAPGVHVGVLLAGILDAGGFLRLYESGVSG